jgi:hypothetical protein
MEDFYAFHVNMFFSYMSFCNAIQNLNSPLYICEQKHSYGIVKSIFFSI